MALETIPFTSIRDSFKINEVRVPVPSSFTPELTVLASSEERNEGGILSTSAINQLYKFCWSYDTILGCNLKKILGETWSKTADDKTFKFKVTSPYVDGTCFKLNCYYKLAPYTCIEMGNNPDSWIYTGFKIDWIGYGDDY